MLKGVKHFYKTNIKPYITPETKNVNALKPKYESLGLITPFYISNADFQ